MKTAFFLILLLLLVTMPNLAILESFNNDQTFPKTSTPDIKVKSEAQEQIPKKQANALPERPRDALASREISLPYVQLSVTCLGGCNVRIAKIAHVERRYTAYKNKVPP